MSESICEGDVAKKELGEKIECTERIYTEKMKANFGFFGLGTFLYACFYAFCMFHNPSGITFPFFIGASLLFGCLCLSKLGITLRKGSGFYTCSMILLAVSTFCTDDARIINMNKMGIFLLMISLLLNQFYDTSRWQLGKYVTGIATVVFCSLGELDRPFRDGNAYRKTLQKGKWNKVFYAIIGCLAALPLFAVVFLLLVSADAVFREGVRELFKEISAADVFQILLMVIGMFLAVYCILAYVCDQHIREEVRDRRTGEPVLAITVTGMLTALYLVFSVIQIMYLFIGNMKLPEGYTYAGYAREGFFQLLIVSALNLVIVLCALSLFRESKVLKAVLAVMSFCTFIMIASSAMRMMIYIRYYYLTFLRIFVLWALLVLTFLFAGVVIRIFRGSFPLFRYCCVAVTCCYLVLSYCHPDYWIAKVNVSHVEQDEEGSFFMGESYVDISYLSGLCADAAPVLVPWIAERGAETAYSEKAAYGEQAQGIDAEVGNFDSRVDGNTPEYIRRMNRIYEKYDGLLQFNMSRYMAHWQIERAGYAE